MNVPGFVRDAVGRLRRRRPMSDFFEEAPAWDMPDLGLERLDIEPRQVEVGVPTTFSVSAANLGVGTSGHAEVRFHVNGDLVGVVPVEPLAPGQRVELRLEWEAEVSGPHQVWAELELRRGWVNDDTGHRRVDSRFWAAADEPQPADIELVLATTRFEDDGRTVFVVDATNVGIGMLEPTVLHAHLDGERIGSVEIDRLRSNATHRFEIEHDRPLGGDHVLSVSADWPDTLYEREAKNVVGWHVSIPGVWAASSATTPGRWSSIGPRILSKGQPDGSQGRVDHLAVHPTDSKTLYAGAVRGGLWKSVDGGDGWFELTDDLAKQYDVGLADTPMRAGGVALDPGDPDIVYFGTGSSRYAGGVGIFKSVNGGSDWHRIADRHRCTGVSKIHAARAADGSVVVYAATNKGLLRLRSRDPKVTNIEPHDWTVLRTGPVEELVVDPGKPGTVYISVIGPSGMDGLYRCTDADSVTGSATWTDIGSGLPAMDGIVDVRIDLCRAQPRTLYASTRPTKTRATTSPRLTIFRSDDRGDSWAPQRSFGAGQPTDGALYNPYIRVHPSNPGLVWFGGVNLFKIDFTKINPTPVQLFPPHDDQHSLTFDLIDPDRYYATGDGGVWRLQLSRRDSSWFWTPKDKCEHRNTDLRVLEFYDFDVAENNPELILGGTQDNGTVVYTGSDDWNAAYQPRGGDGAYSPINGMNHDVVLSQHQFLGDTMISTSGPKGPWIGGFLRGKGHPNEDLYIRAAYVTFRPGNPDVVATAGDEVWATDNATQYTTDSNGSRHSSAHWTARGPSGPTVKGSVTRVMFQPGTSYWYAGTSTGQIWRSNHGIRGTWSLIDRRSFDEAPVVGMAFAPTNKDILYVLYAGGDTYRRVQRLQGLSGAVTGTWMGDNFPANRSVCAISGDGYDDGIVYVGTDKGVFQSDRSRPQYDRWQAYNDGLPLVRINDLVVPTGRVHPAPPGSERSVDRALFAASRGRGAWVTQTC